MADERVCIYSADLRVRLDDAPGIEVSRTLMADSPGDLGHKFGRIPSASVVSYELADVEDGEPGTFRPWTDMEKAAFEAGIEQHTG